MIEVAAKRTVFRISDHRAVTVSLKAMRHFSEPEEVDRFRHALVEIDTQFDGGDDRPKAPLGALVDDATRDRFLTLMGSYRGGLRG